MLTSLAPAKINLVLEVLGKFDNGYHEIRSLMQTINLYDTLSFELDDRISLECTEPSLQSPDNLVIQAAELLKEASGYDKGAKIGLEKRIPWGAGLGGGSSDAAATLVALNRLWNLGLGTPDMLKLAVKLGSDAAFFIYGGTAFTEGRGEKVTPLPIRLQERFIMLLPPLPKIRHKTQQLYARLNRQHFTHGQHTDKALEALSSNEVVNPSLMFNVFDGVAFDAFPGLEYYWRRFERAGATNIHLAGSGPIILTPVSSETRAKELHHCLRQEGLEVYPVSAAY